MDHFSCVLKPVKSQYSLKIYHIFYLYFINDVSNNICLKLQFNYTQITPILCYPYWRDVRDCHYKYIYFNYSRYLRSIAYREFSRLVYGFLGDQRIPLPACAYSSIRKTFPLSKDEEHTGFDFGDEEEETTDEESENMQ